MKAVRVILAVIAGVVAAYFAHAAIGGRYYTSVRTGYVVDGLTGRMENRYGGTYGEFR